MFFLCFIYFSFKSYQYTYLMGKRGPKPTKKVNTEWTPNFAYAIGLIASDGCLSSDGRHITFVSKDIEQIENYKKSLNINNKTRMHSSGSTSNLAFRVQFGDINFYEFLNSIGLTSVKSLTIGELLIPDFLFFHFLRGLFDGDGCTYSYFDKRWKSSFMLYFCFSSASSVFINWIQSKIKFFTGIKGHITSLSRTNTCYNLKYAKTEALQLIKNIYPSEGEYLFLKRKKLKIDQSLCIIGELLNRDVDKDAQVL